MKQEKDSIIIQLFEHKVSLKYIHDMSNLKYEEIGKILDDYYDKKNKSSKSRWLIYFNNFVIDIYISIRIKVKSCKYLRQSLHV